MQNFFRTKQRPSLQSSGACLYQTQTQRSAEAKQARPPQKRRRGDESSTPAAGRPRGLARTGPVQCALPSSNPAAPHATRVSRRNPAPAHARHGRPPRPSVSVHAPGPSRSRLRRALPPTPILAAHPIPPSCAEPARHRPISSGAAFFFLPPRSFALFLSRCSTLRQPTLRCSPAPSISHPPPALHSSMEFSGESAAAAAATT